jgi:nucleotide-binding universal stress UspA family protein
MIEPVRQQEQQVPSPTVLVPLDGSQLAEASLLYLRALAPMGRFSVELIHVEEPGDDQTLGERGWDARAYLQTRADRLKKQTGLHVTSLNLTGVPYATILAQAENPWTSLILMTTHGLTGFQRWRVGSVADKVIRGAPCPLLLIGPSTRGAPPAVERVLVPLDGSELAEEALPYARELAEKLDSRVRLLRAAAPRAVPDELVGTFDADISASLEMIAEKYLAEVRLELETPQGVESVVEAGPAAEAIISQVEQAPCDLVVMTSHGRHGFVRFALGSVTDRVLEASPAPVLVVRPGQWDRFRPLVGAE